MQALSRFVLEQCLINRDTTEDKDVMGWKSKAWLQKKYKDDDKVDQSIDEKTRLGLCRADRDLPTEMEFYVVVDTLHINNKSSKT